MSILSPISPSFDIGKVGISAIGGAAGGFTGSLGHGIAQAIKKSGGYGSIYNFNVRDLNAYKPAGDYGYWGAAAGGAAGTYGGNLIANQ